MHAKSSFIIFLSLSHKEISIQQFFYHFVIKIRHLFYDRPPAWRQLGTKWVLTIANTASIVCKICPYGLHIWRMSHNTPRGPTTYWRVLTTANALPTRRHTRLSHQYDKQEFFLVCRTTDFCTPFTPSLLERYLHNEAGTYGLPCLPKHGGAGECKFLVTHPMTDHCDRMLSALTALPSFIIMCDQLFLQDVCYIP
jgi:hypothetical protein